MPVGFLAQKIVVANRLSRPKPPLRQFREGTIWLRRNMKTKTYGGCSEAQYMLAVVKHLME
jgi:hypothetical protein